MSSQLYVYLPISESEPLSACCLDLENGARRFAVAESFAALVSKLGLPAATPLRVLVPGHAVLQQEVSLPTSGAKASQALPFLLEDSLCQDVGSMHLAHGNILANQAFWVSAISQELMTALHNRLRFEGDVANALRLQGVWPDNQALPLGSSAECGGLRLFNGEQLKGVVEADAGEALAQLAAEKLDNLTLPSIGPASVITDGDVDEQSVQRLALLGLWQESVFSAGLTPLSESLTQGEYAPSSPVREHFLRWRPAAIAAGLCFALLLAGLAVEQAQLKQQLRAADAQMRDLYKQAYPRERLRNPYKQLRAKLGAASGDEGGACLMAWLQVSATEIQRVEGKPSQLQFRSQAGDSGELRISLQLPSYQSSDELVAALQQRGLIVSKGSFAQAAQGVQGQIIIRGGDV